MTNAKYRKLTSGLIVAWFFFSLSASALHVFRTGPDRSPLPLGLAVLIPVAAFSAWVATSQPFRKFVLTLSPRTLTFVQSWRVVGFVFLVLHQYGILPGVFALPAGWGDIVVGATAPIVAMKLTSSSHRNGFIGWQVLGMLDLVMAIVLGTTAALIDSQAVSTSAMGDLPLSLIPTFAVPLLLIFHLICIAQALRWRERRYTGVGEQLPSSVA